MSSKSAARYGLSTPHQGRRGPVDLLLDGLALRTIDGCAAAAPTLRRAAEALGDVPVGDVLRWGWVAPVASMLLWDIDGLLNDRYVQLIRDAGALAELPTHLMALATATAWTGDFAGAASLIAEAEGVVAATGSRRRPYASLRLKALQGREAETSALRAAIGDAAPDGHGFLTIQADWAAAILYNGLSRYEEAAAAARRATSDLDLGASPVWALPELVEAAVRLGDTALAGDAFQRLAETTQPCGNDFGLGLEARCRALLSEGSAADALYRESIGRLSRTPLLPELARAHLLYGEWLRREGRPVDAREQLRTAHDMFLAIGMEAFGERARRELLATGEKVRKRSDETRGQLTPQEEQIARLARDGLSNRGDRRDALPQSPHHRMASPQDLYEARDQLPQAAPGSASRQRASPGGRVAVTETRSAARRPGGGPVCSTGATGGAASDARRANEAKEEAS